MKDYADKTPLIGEYDASFKAEENEPVFKDFVSRRDFINRTEVYVSPAYFGIIHDKFMESGVSAEEFVTNYEEKYSTYIYDIPLHGTFRYEYEDAGADCLFYKKDYQKEPNIWEIVNSVDLSLYHKWMQADKLKVAYEKVAAELREQLLKNVGPNNKIPA